MSEARMAAPVENAMATIARSRLRRRLAAVAAGERKSVALDLGDRALDAAGLVVEVAAPFGPGSRELERLAGALKTSGLYDTVLDQLTAKAPERRARSAKLAGALRIEAVVPTLAELVSEPERTVSQAAARALGRIGGARSAAGLLHAAEQGAQGATLVIQLARAAPDLFLEAALGEAGTESTSVQVAAAAGLRRRSAAVRPLVAMLHGGTPAQRAVSCRALGWMGAEVATPTIASALHDPSSLVRLSAAKALQRLYGRGGKRPVREFMSDPPGGGESCR